MQDFEELLTGTPCRREGRQGESQLFLLFFFFTFLFFFFFSFFLKLSLKQPHFNSSLEQMISHPLKYQLNLTRFYLEVTRELPSKQTKQDLICWKCHRLTAQELKSQEQKKFTINSVQALLTHTHSYLHMENPVTVFDRCRFWKLQQRDALDLRLYGMSASDIILPAVHGTQAWPSRWFFPSKTPPAPLSCTGDDLLTGETKERGPPWSKAYANSLTLMSYNKPRDNGLVVTSD